MLRDRVTSIITDFRTQVRTLETYVVEKGRTLLAQGEGEMLCSVTVSPPPSQHPVHEENYKSEDAACYPRVKEMPS